MAEKNQSGDFTRLFRILGFFWAFGFGIFATVASLTLESAGLSHWEIGLQSSAYYLCIGLSSLFVPWIISLFGKRCVFFGMVMAGLTCLVFPLAGDWYSWMLLRGGNGLAAAMSLVPLETMVIQQSPVEKKNRFFGYFELSLALGFGAGGALGPALETVKPGLSYLLGGTVILLGAVLALPIPTSLAQEQRLEGPSPSRVLKCWVWFSTAFTQGFLEGGLLTFAGLQIIGLGYGNREVAFVFASMFFGVVVSMLGVARLADRFGGIRILALTHGISLLLLMGLSFSNSINWIITLVWGVGLAYGCQYAIALVALEKEFPKSQQPGANALYLALNCLGSVLGPVLISLFPFGMGLNSLWQAGAFPILVLILAWLGMACLRPGRTGNW
ncbi:MAG: MFS transporter [Gemmataceae bacterium]|nr:MFS transporter [Gemmataceae bacterium]